jgi:hypothetical protein
MTDEDQDRMIRARRGETSSAKQSLWSTPRSITGGVESLERKRKLGRTESGGGDLQAETQEWPTPANRDYRSPNLKPYGERGGQTKGEQLSNFVEHMLPDWKRQEMETVGTHTCGICGTVFQGDMSTPCPTREMITFGTVAYPSSLLAPETVSDGRRSSETTPNWNPPAVDSIGSATDFETLTYCQWARRAWSRQGRTETSPSSGTESAEDELEDSSEPPSPESGRDRKQKKLWAYRQRTMGWANPLTATRVSFRRRLNADFVDVLMGWPAGWTSARTVLGPEVMESWLLRARRHLSSYVGGQ